MDLVRHGVVINENVDLVFLHEDPKLGLWLLLRGARHEVTIRVTPSGLLRVGDVKSSGPIRAAGIP